MSFGHHHGCQDLHPTIIAKCENRDNMIIYTTTVCEPRISQTRRAWGHCCLPERAWVRGCLEYLAGQTGGHIHLLGKCLSVKRWREFLVSEICMKC